MMALIACGVASTIQTPTITPSLPTTAKPTPTVALSPTLTAAEPTSQPTQEDEPTPEGQPAVSNELRYLALGDSYTIGQGVEFSERWPVQLVQRLREDGVIISTPEIIARTGWSTSQLAEGIARADPEGQFDLVTLMIGVNNQFRGSSIEQYRKEFSVLLLQSADFAGEKASRVIVVSTPDWGVTPFARGLDRDQIAREIDQFNLVAIEETKRAGAIFVDITGISRLAAEQRNLLAPDGLHPSGVMYSRWVDLIFPVAQAITTDATTTVR